MAAILIIDGLAFNKSELDSLTIKPGELHGYEPAKTVAGNKVLLSACRDGKWRKASQAQNWALENGDIHPKDAPDEMKFPDGSIVWVAKYHDEENPHCVFSDTECVFGIYFSEGTAA